MHKLIVLYPEPTDREEFIRYYEATHLPLCHKLPGITSMSYSFEVSTNQPGYFAVFEAEFPDTATFAASMTSAEGKAVSADVPNYATGGAVVLNFPVAEASKTLLDTN